MQIPGRATAPGFLLSKTLSAEGKSDAISAMVKGPRLAGAGWKKEER
jgi:hypothetical protein